MFSERRVFRGPPSGRAVCLVRRLALSGLVTHRSSPRSVQTGKGKRRGGNFSSPQPSVACHLWEAGQSLRFSVFIGSNEWRRPGSNRQPPACKAGALPVELRPPRAVMSSGRRPNRERRGPERTASPQPAPVGTRGFEPRTSALSELRSNQLSYAPILTGAAILAHPPAPVQPSGFRPKFTNDGPTVFGPGGILIVGGRVMWPAAEVKLAPPSMLRSVCQQTCCENGHPVAASGRRSQSLWFCRGRHFRTSCDSLRISAATCFSAEQCDISAR